ncbi:hypothetical protein ACO2Q3_16375 [Caulobacter sp. KR2-114]|uniref:hypothetical protein n=1 Tax=Caulobacter sp. KR2-114 TaxID=3400912 RepID=UPI003C0CBE9F
MLSKLRADLSGKGPPAPPPAGADAVDLADLSSAACIALAQRLEGQASLALTDAQAQRLRALATPDCVMARARILKAASRDAEAQALLREGWRLAGARQAQIALTYAASAQDAEFAAIAADADAARDRGDFTAAEGLFARALALYPLHHGCQVQHGHMQKDTGRLAGAEIAYRSALALGAPPADVLRHLAFVCERQDVAMGEPARLRGAARPIDEAPAAFDVDALAYLFWHDVGLGEGDMLDILRHAPTCEAAAVRLARDPRFMRRNGALLRMMRAQS